MDIALSERQETVLRLVVDEHVATNTPVGSKFLAARSGLSVSASTIRNDLAELETLGLLTHPHTSAGRLPTEDGYRYYAGRLVESSNGPTTDLDLDLSELRQEVHTALQLTTEAVAELTHLLAVTSAPRVETTVVRHVELIQLQPDSIVLVVITAAGEVYKKVLQLSQAVERGLIEAVAEYLNDCLSGARLGSRLIRSTFNAPGLDDSETRILSILEPTFDELVRTERSVFYGGAADMIPAFSGDNVLAARRLLELLDERTDVLELLRETLDSKRPFVRVGRELEEHELEGVSIVGASYGLAHRNLGTVSVVGPSRMDYGTAIGVVRSAARSLSGYAQEVYDD
jgi:heat-inducible transcriptional repressor